MKQIVLGRIRMRIMQVLWEKGRLNAQEITNTINEFETVAHSTVQTHLRALEAQGAVGHDSEDRTFIYFPLMERENVMKSKTREFIDLLFAGSAESLVAYLANNKYISREDVRETLKLFDKTK